MVIKNRSEERLVKGLFNVFLYEESEQKHH